jgi:hypothetical protein
MNVFIFLNIRLRIDIWGTHFIMKPLRITHTSYSPRCQRIQRELAVSDYNCGLYAHGKCSTGMGWIQCGAGGDKLQITRTFAIHQAPTTIPRLLHLSSLTTIFHPIVQARNFLDSMLSHIYIDIFPFPIGIALDSRDDLCAVFVRLCLQSSVVRVQANHGLWESGDVNLVKALFNYVNECRYIT